MLGKSSQKDLEIVKEAIATFWGDNCVIEDINIIDGPFPQFIIKLKLYKLADVDMEYDRGTLSISLKRGNEYTVLSQLTDKKVYRGFEGFKYDNMIHNFGTLDEIVRKQISQA